MAINNNLQDKTKSQIAALYVRVSTEEQAREGFSINAQAEALTQYCSLYDIKIHNIYKDLGVSGKSMNKRKGLQDMLKDAKLGLFNIVLVWKISRLSRSLKDLLLILDSFEKYHVDFVSYSEKLDTSTPVGRMTLQLLGSIAEFERNTIVENVKLGLNEFARSGGKAASVLGYDNINKCLKINEHEARIVRTVFDLYTRDYISMSKIAIHLNTLGYTTKRGKKFRSDSISVILQNPVYIGINRHNINSPEEYSIDGGHTPIIDIDIWNKAQKRISSSQKQLHQSDNQRASLLNGLIRCPVCSKPLRIFYTYSKGRCYRYYKCYASNELLIGSGCSGFLINADMVEKEVEPIVLNIITSNSVVADVNLKLKNDPASKCAEILNKLSELEAEISRQNEIINNYFLLFEKGRLDNNELLLERLNILEQQIKLLEKEKQQYESKSSDINHFYTVNDIGYITEYLISIYQALEHEDKRRIITALILEIHVDAEKQIKKIIYNFPINYKLYKSQ